jgi:hypothetical protein
MLDTMATIQPIQQEFEAIIEMNSIDERSVSMMSLATPSPITSNRNSLLQDQKRHKVFEHQMMSSSDFFTCADI